MSRLVMAFCVWLSMVSIYLAEAQEKPIHIAQAPEMVREGQHGMTIEFYLSLAILVFGFAALAVQSILIRNAKTPWHPKSVLSITGLTLIICAALFLITAGYSANQVSPVMGLLGTIAGYLLGSGERGGKTL